MTSATLRAKLMAGSGRLSGRKPIAASRQNWGVRCIPQLYERPEPSYTLVGLRRSLVRRKHRRAEPLFLVPVAEDITPLFDVPGALLVIAQIAVVDAAGAAVQGEDGRPAFVAVDAAPLKGG